MVEWGKLIFGGIDSSDYGIYITGEAVYNAPERDVEFIDVPGRNGSIAMDNGRYRNITVTYPAGCFGTSQKEFRKKVSRFRNAILSQRGYQRLEDSYHPEEYRMGVYASGLEVSPASYGRAGEFTLTFECKPQRFLTVGDYPVPLDSGDVLQNPTLFESGPLVEISGYGTVGFNGYEIEVENNTIGDVELIDRIQFYYQNDPNQAPVYNTVDSLTFDDSTLLSGDTITIQKGTGTLSYARFVVIFRETNPWTLTNVSITASGSDTASLGYYGTGWREGLYQANVNAYIYPVSDITFSYGTASTRTLAATVSFTLENNGTTKSITAVCSCVISYDGAHTLTFTYTMTLTGAPSSWTGIGELVLGFSFMSPYAVVGNSTMIAWSTVWVDCDLGEAYMYNSGKLVNMNSKIALGSDLPKLKPGNNVVMFDNTITNLKITPRWWRI